MATAVMVPTEGGENPCLINNWAHKEGDKVELGDMLCEAETDKSVLDILATANGTLLKILYGNGQEAPVLTPIAVIGEPGEDISEFLAPQLTSGTHVEEPLPTQESGSSPELDPGCEDHPNTVEPAGSEPVPAFKEQEEHSARSEVLISPRARKYAEKNDISLEGLKGTGYLNSIVERDVAAHCSIVTSPKASEKSEEPDYTVYQLSRVEQVSGKRLLKSLSESAQATMSIQINADKLKALHKELRGQGAQFGLSGITINDMFMFAAAKVLCRHPRVNSIFSDGELRQYRHVHISMAVATEKGLYVPVIPYADELSLPELSQKAKYMAQRAHEGLLLPSEQEGGTITVSNLGARGITVFTPIINPPQVCILGVGGIRPGLVTRGDEIVPGYVMEVSLTHDHRVLDGAPCADFLKELAGFIAEFDIASLAY